MSPALHDLFGVSKPIIAMVHLRALPGRPRHDREAGMRPITEAVARDLAALQDAGVDGLLFCNEADLPYRLSVGPEAAAAMAAVIGEVGREIRRPFGVDLVWDPVASLAVARATGASFVREVFTGVYESDLGIMRPDFGSIAAYRAGIGAESVALFANITPEFASSLGPRTITERAPQRRLPRRRCRADQRPDHGDSHRHRRAARREGGAPSGPGAGQHRCDGGHRGRDPGRRGRGHRGDNPQTRRCDMESG